MTRVQRESRSMELRFNEHVFFFSSLSNFCLFPFLFSENYCTLEVDSYSYFFRKGKTKTAKGSEPQWDEVK